MLGAFSFAKVFWPLVRKYKGVDSVTAQAQRYRDAETPQERMFRNEEWATSRGRLGV